MKQLVYIAGSGQGPEPVDLAHGINVTPGVSFAAADAWAAELLRSYPQIQLCAEAGPDPIAEPDPEPVAAEPTRKKGKKS